MDPRLAERWMEDGSLPNFARLRNSGHYQALPTSNPAQSPVAWTSFATGLNPGAHGIFDFLHRDAETYGPTYSITEVTPPESVIGAFGWQLPLDAGSTRMQRSGTAFWTTAERHGLNASVLRVPATYPADPITRMLSGMGVPDLLGTQGTFTVYSASDDTVAASDETTGIRVVPVEASGGRVDTVFAGPMHPLLEAPTPLTVSLTVEESADSRVEVSIGGTAIELGEGDWSDWITLQFEFAGLMDVSGTVRLHLMQAFPDLRLYVSPIQPDPRDPVVPLASPIGYASDLAERIGLYHTIGMPEETWSLNEEQISDAAYLDMVRTILAEREAMFFDTLDRQDSDLVVAVFVQTDRVSHMFWRGIDPAHPMHHTADAAGRQAIRWIYGEADRILGRTLDSMQSEDRLIVLSDHGFNSFRRGVNLNRWLVQEGFMSLKPGTATVDSLLANVDWTKTRAYALGLNTLFLNRMDRESLGIVRDEEAESLKQEIREKLVALRDTETDSNPVATVVDADELYGTSPHAAAPDLVIGYSEGYRASWETALGGVPEDLIVDNAKKWSGDHLIDPAFVPGVLFTSFPIETPVSWIGDVPDLVERSLGIDKTRQAEGTAPSRGVLDIASPVLSAIDRVAAFLMPSSLRIALWGALAAFVSMLIYKWTSNQKRLAELKSESLEIRKRLDSFDGELNDLWPILGKNISTAFRQLGRGLIPAIIASVPVVFILAWMSNAFDARFPETGEEVLIEAVPDSTHQLPPMRWAGGDYQVVGTGRWAVSWPAGDNSMQLLDSDGTTLVTLPTEAAVSVVHQRRWWNDLIGNPAGYLPSPGDVDEVRLELPGVEFQPFGPSWLRSWITLFFAVIVLVSLGLKRAWQLH